MRKLARLEKQKCATKEERHSIWTQILRIEKRVHSLEKKLKALSRKKARWVFLTQSHQSEDIRSTGIPGGATTQGSNSDKSHTDGASTSGGQNRAEADTDDVARTMGQPNGPYGTLATGETNDLNHTSRTTQDKSSASSISEASNQSTSKNQKRGDSPSRSWVTDRLELYGVDEDGNLLSPPEAISNEDSDDERRRKQRWYRYEMLGECCAWHDGRRSYGLPEPGGNQSSDLRTLLMVRGLGYLAYAFDVRFAAVTRGN